MDFQTLGLNNTEINKIESKSGFWKRQFQIEATDKQRTFDSIFGMILPTICFLFDPIVFRDSEFGSAEFGAFKPFTYLLSYFSIMSLLAFMLWGARLRWLNGFLCGLFAVGALISFVIGIVLLPISLIGLIFLIGALGFTPLFTSLVYARSAVRAYCFAKPSVDRKLLLNSILLSVVLSLSLPILVNRKIESGLQTMRNGDAKTTYNTAQRLKFFAPLLDANRLYGADCRGEDGEKYNALINGYQQLSGKSIQNSDYYYLCNY